jgi:hypothetical protein
LYAKIELTHVKNGKAEKIHEALEEGEGARTKRRPTKVSLNDTLRRIRYLMVEGWSNLEIQIYYSLKSASFIDI